MRSVHQDKQQIIISVPAELRCGDLVKTKGLAGPAALFREQVHRRPRRLLKVRRDDFKGQNCTCEQKCYRDEKCLFFKFFKRSTKRFQSVSFLSYCGFKNLCAQLINHFQVQTHCSCMCTTECDCMFCYSTFGCVCV